jgi:hypothetical protein
MRIKAVIIIILFSIALFGCKKKKEVQIVGTWVEVPMTEQPAEYAHKWDFIEDGTLIHFEYEVAIDTAEYAMVYKFPKYYVDISGLGETVTSQSGRYRIDDMDDEVLKMTRIEHEDGSTNAAFLRREFYRE